MAESVYEEVALGDMEFDEEEEVYRYECPCGDKFEITVDELLDGEDIAHCPSCSLIVRVIYDLDALTAQYEPSQPASAPITA